MSGYILSPAADLDLDTIWEYIAHDNINAADDGSQTYLMHSRLWRGRLAWS